MNKKDIIAKEKLIIESFAKTFNSIKRTNEAPVRPHNDNLYDNSEFEPTKEQLDNFFDDYCEYYGVSPDQESWDEFWNFTIEMNKGKK